MKNIFEQRKLIANNYLINHFSSAFKIAEYSFIGIKPSTESVFYLFVALSSFYQYFFIVKVYNLKVEEVVIRHSEKTCNDGKFEDAFMNLVLKEIRKIHVLK